MSVTVTSPSRIVFGNRLKGLRLMKNLSQAELAAQIHVSATTINRYENGQREPSLDTLNVIAHFFGVDFNYLLCDSDEFLQHCNPEILEKYDVLDDRGKAAVLNVLEYEYALISTK